MKERREKRIMKIKADMIEDAYKRSRKRKKRRDGYEKRERRRRRALVSGMSEDIKRGIE